MNFFEELVGDVLKKVGIALALIAIAFSLALHSAKANAQEYRHPIHASHEHRLDLRPIEAVMLAATAVNTATAIEQAYAQGYSQGYQPMPVAVAPVQQVIQPVWYPLWQPQVVQATPVVWIARAPG